MPAPLYLYNVAKKYDPPYSQHKAGATVFINIYLKLRSSVSYIEGRRHCIYTIWLKHTISRIVHTRPAPLYSYKFAENYDPQYNPYKAGVIVFI